VDSLIVVEYFAGKPEQKQFISRALTPFGQHQLPLMLFSVAEGHYIGFIILLKNHVLTGYNRRKFGSLGRLKPEDFLL
jgi:hypothetical protein